MNAAIEEAPTQAPLHGLMKKSDRIFYLVPFEREALKDASVFRLYSRGLMRTAPLHVAATQLPADIREISCDWPTIAAFRVAGAVEHMIVPLFLDALPATMKLLQNRPFRCVLSDPLTAPVVEQLLADQPRDWLHLSLQGDSERGIEQLPADWSDFVSRLQNRLEGAMTPAARRGLSRIQASIDGPITVANRPLSYKPSTHGLTSMNLYAVFSMGAIPEDGVVLTSKKHSDYVDAVLESVGEVNQHRLWLKSGAPNLRYQNRLCIAVPSMLSEYYESKVAKNNRFKQDHPLLHEVVLTLARQKTYTHELREEMAESEEVAGYFKEHAAELRALVSSLSLFASRTLTPVLRLEPRINTIRSNLPGLAKMARSNHKRLPFKLNRDARNLMEAMSKAIDPRYLELITPAAESTTEGMKLATDLPLEWLPVGNLPLMMAFETSRVTVTPGNVSFDQLSVAKTQTEFLSVSSFVDILVIRSFTADDGIRFHLQRAIDAVRKVAPLERLNVRIVDVATPDEFIETWNSFRGAVLIFDGHGRVDPETGQGQLVLNGIPVTLWDHKEAIHNTPPIVILCACDTHAVDANHTSVANTMLMLGARTVLGTYLPVLASYSSAFIARLLLRIAQYIPIAAAQSFEMRTTWRSVVTGMQRMTYVTEVLLALAENEKINVLQHYGEICNKANHDINFGDPLWHENFLNLLARLTGEPVEHLLKSISKWASLVDVMHYIQLGNPETLHIVTDDFYEELFPSEVDGLAELKTQVTVESAAIAAQSDI
ncbi:CHAT domain-containing protein [Cupriavidus necator]|uniref:CHAT domain-containing protein n=1 Tax=Cupriavidus necator TaxID=106590 RepID=UPI00278B0D5C|nr:CHAT domain-containing protein [Cupriavidus necator]MDQ0140959.1 hypothetical protein [Cupriavidus necator]